VAGHAAGSPVTIRVTIPDVPAEAGGEITRGLRETIDRIASLTME